MALTYKAAFPQKLVTKSAVCTAAKTTLGDVTNAVLLHTLGEHGGELVSLSVMPRGNITALQCNLFVSKDGAALSLIASVSLSGFSYDATAAIPRVTFTMTDQAPDPFAAGDMLYVGIGVAAAAGIVFHAKIREY